MEKTVPPQYIHLTYSVFQEPVGEFEHDVGWGCTYRSGQMMLANAFWKHGRMDVASVLTLFQDIFSAPFSLCNIVPTFGKWGSPSTVACRMARVRPSPVPIRLVGNGSACNTNGNTAEILLVPIRLGKDCIESTYIPRLQELLDFPGCIGCICGRGNQSFYAVQQDRQIKYLDPHFMCDEGILPHRPETHVTSRVHDICLTNLDPCLTLGFYVDCAELKHVLDVHLQLVPMTLCLYGSAGDGDSSAGNSNGNDCDADSSGGGKSLNHQTEDMEEWECVN